MENKEQEFVYLTRVLKEPYCEFLEIFLNGGEVNQLGKPSSATVPSSVESRIDETFADASTYAKKTAEISSYFFYSPANEDGLNELRRRTQDLLYSPANESGAIKQNNGQKCSADELYGGEIKSMLILKAPLELLTAMGKMGLAELRSGEYGKDGEKSIYDEIAIGDDGLKHILRTAKDCDIMAYGEFHNIMNNKNIFSDAKYNQFDEESLFENSYAPEYNINVFDEMAKEKQTKEKNDENLHSKELAELDAWFKDLDTSTLSKEELDNIMASIAETRDFYSNTNLDEDSLEM